MIALILKVHHESVFHDYYSQNNRCSKLSRYEEMPLPINQCSVIGPRCWDAYMINSFKQIPHCPPASCEIVYQPPPAVIKSPWMGKQPFRAATGSDVSLAEINNPSVIACGAIPYFIHAMSHNLGGNYYEHVIYHPTPRDNGARVW